MDNVIACNYETTYDNSGNVNDFRNSLSIRNSWKGRDIKYCYLKRSLTSSPVLCKIKSLLLGSQTDHMQLANMQCFKCHQQCKIKNQLSVNYLSFNLYFVLESRNTNFSKKYLNKFHINVIADITPMIWQISAQFFVF